MDNVQAARVGDHRARGSTWLGVAVAEGFPTANAARSAYNRWRAKQDKQPPTYDQAGDDPNETQEEVIVSGRRFKDIRSLDDLVAFFDIDLDVWEIVGHTLGMSEWDQSVEKGTVAQSVKIKATFKRKVSVEQQAAQQAFEDLKADALSYSYSYSPEHTTSLLTPRNLQGHEDGEACMFELAIHDPHLGMLAWAPEVGGVSQDLKTITEDYAAAVERLLPLAHLYNTEEIVYIVGHDLTHVNQYGINKSGGTTAGGTAQDVDGRIAKIFTAARQAVVAGVDLARTIARVKVIVVPGNHDVDESYRLGEVLNAWYRKADDVEVQYSANKRQFHGFGANAFMFTHGEEYRRKRDSLPMIMADECPPELWVASAAPGCREIHTGHNHVNLAGGYYPTAEATESRGIRTRSLPGLTATDAWHHESGYRHRRSASALIYRKSGGIVGQHEFNL